MERQKNKKLAPGLAIGSQNKKEPLWLKKGGRDEDVFHRLPRWNFSLPHSETWDGMKQIWLPAIKPEARKGINLQQPDISLTRSAPLQGEMGKDFVLPLYPGIRTLGSRVHGAFRRRDWPRQSGYRRRRFWLMSTIHDR